MPQSDCTIISEQINTVLSGFPEVHFCTLFGSAARGRLMPHSDVDISIAAEHEVDAERMVEVSLAVSKLLGREVDLIDLHTVSGLILKEALCTGVIVKNTDSELYSKLLKRLWYNQADMMPLVKRILEERCRRWTR